MPIDPGKSRRLVIVVSNELAAAVEELAAKDRRPVSSYVRNLLEDKVQEEAREA